MINLADIRRPVIAGLKSYTTHPVIMADTTGNQPAYPFYTLKVTLTGQGIGQVAEAMDVKMGLSSIEQDTEMILSITCHAADISEAHDLTYKARSYFLGKGHIELSDQNITVVDALAITNRDVFLNIEYERRYGFDVRLRIRGQESFDAEVIENIEM